MLFKYSRYLKNGLKIFLFVQLTDGHFAKQPPWFFKDARY